MRGEAPNPTAESRLTSLEAEQLLTSSLLRAIPAVVLRVSVEGRIDFVNRVLPEYQGASLVGQTIYAFAAPDQHEVMRASLAHTVHTREACHFEAQARAPDGTVDWYRTTISPILDGDRLTAVTFICFNITQQRATEAALRESRARLDVALNAGNVGLWLWDAVTDTVEWDPKLRAMFQVSEQDSPRTFAAFLALVSEDQRNALRDHIESAMKTGSYGDFELRADFTAGRRWFIIKGGPQRDAAGKISGLMGGVVDNTERRQLEEQVRQVQKLEALGQLSAGLAHNFNNLLGGIVPVLEVAKSRADPEIAAALDGALESALQAAKLIRQLMVFSRSPTAEAARRESLEASLTRALELCRPTLDPRITLSRSGFEAARGVAVDGAQLEQALLNLLLNARDALEGREDGRACVEVTVHRRSEREVSRLHPTARGEHVEVLVRDTGVGMSEAIRRRIFEPFFTTKPIGRGTGLGLSTAWATVRAHGGYLDCESAPNAGTVFSVLLPIAAGMPLPEPTALPGTGAQGKRVLMIDDDARVREAIAVMLRQRGYQVFTAASGVEGVSLAAQHEVDVVLLDYSMPGQSAQATLAQLREWRPGLPVLCFSGLEVTLEGATAHLPKPATGDTLVAALERALAH